MYTTDCLYKGPCLNPLLFDILLRFRVHNIALTADIEKAFLQISVATEDRDYLRFLWYKDVFSDLQEVIKLRFARVIFGATCSQFLLNGTVKTHAEKYSKVDPEFSKKILRHFYVDDLNTGISNEEEGLKLYKKVKFRFQEAGLNIRKWRTNDKNLRELINSKEENVGINEKEEEFNIEGDKILGITWNENEDTMIINLKNYIKEAESVVVTKRNVLSVIASFYDPIGLIQPIVVKLKILFQEICKKNVNWDDELSNDLKEKWIKIIHGMKRMENIVIARCYCITEINDPIINIELHGFSDASQVAYGCCVYLKYISRAGNIKISLITSKSRIAPLRKNITIPRLELLGNLILSRLVVAVLLALKEEIDIKNVICWSDSQISLAWVKAVDKEFKTFVQNRVVEIRKNVEKDKWFYCRSQENPADIITRLNEFSLINEKLWWNGPEFLKYDYVDYVEENKFKKEVMDDFYTEDVNNVNTCLLTTEACFKTIDDIIDIHRFNDLLKLYRVTAIVLRFIKNLKSSVKKENINLNKFVTVEEINEAKLLWIKANQHVMKKSKNYEHDRLNLNLVEDNEGIIRSHSRLKNAKIPYDSKAPIMISKEHKLADLIVNYFHLKVLHNGVKQTLTEIRSMFWITRGRNFVKKLIRPCTVCKRINSRPYQYPGQSDIPSFRFDDNQPFSTTGVDYLGPLYCLPVYGEEDVLYKVFIVLYTCAATRAIILDAVNNASSKTFLQSLTKFISRRGCPSLIISDNGSVFKSDETQTFIANKFIKWKFNLETAPWWGGMWERLVGSVKRCIKKMVGIRKINYVELQTLLFEIEAVLNNRQAMQRGTRDSARARYCAPQK